MGALTPAFVTKFEDRMKSIIENEYARLTANLWWQEITKVQQSVSAREILTWLLSTATIKDQGKGGNIAFDDLVAQYTTIENRFSGAGLQLRKSQFTDVYNGIVGGEAMDFGGKWTADIGAYMAYWPQKSIMNILKNGHTASLVTGYDGKALFAADHPINPFNAAAGTFQNIFTGAASGSYPGACPIDDSVTLDVALINLGKIFGYIASIKMPNGEDPRFLRPKALLVPPRLFPRAVQLTSAKFLAQAAAGGVGSADVSMVIQALGFARPIMVDELGGYESDTTFFVAADSIASSQLGALIYVEREPFQINYYDGITQADLNRKNELEWHCIGRNGASAGHPYLIFKCKGS